MHALHLTYTPAMSFSAVDSLSYRLRGGHGACASYFNAAQLCVRCLTGLWRSKARSRRLTRLATIRHKLIIGQAIIMAGRDLHPHSKRPGLEPDKMLAKKSRIGRPPGLSHPKAVDIGKIKAASATTQVRPLQCRSRLLLFQHRLLVSLVKIME